MSVKLLTEHHLEFLSLKGGCTGSSESTLVKMPHCWKSRVAAHITLTCYLFSSAILYSPNVLIPTDEKIIVDDGGHPDMVQEK